MSRARTRFLAACALSGALAAGAQAATTIGNTAVAKNSVTQVAATPTAIGVGDDVFADERVRTGVDSAAKFVFSDSTNLALGPSATVALDRFVYKGDTTYAKAAVTFAAGAFRFTTGVSDKGAYQLKTSTATIGVRGTQFDVSVKGGLTKVTLREGQVAVCPRSRFDGDPGKLTQAQLKRYGCVELTRAGQTAQVTAGSASIGGAPVNFGSNCGTAGLCSVTTAAAAGATRVRTARARPDVQPVADAPAAPVLATQLDPSDPALCYASED